MKILKQDREKNTAILEIEVDNKTFKSAYEKAMAEAGSQMKFPGFRPGKAPRSMVEKAVNPKAVEDRAAQNIIVELYPKIIKDCKLDPVDYPNIEFVTLEEGKPFVFKLSIPVYPEVKLGKYKGLKADKKPVEVNEEEVIKALGNLQNRLAKRIEVKDRPAQKEDWVDFEIQAEAEGAEIKRWPRKMQFYPIGMGMILKDFDEQLIGMKLNDAKQFKIKFPEKYMVKEVAGKEVDFNIKLLRIQAKELHPLDDEFAKRVSKFGTLAELKEEIKKNLELEKKEASEADLKNKLVEEILKNAEVEIPEGMLRAETDIMLDELKASLSRSNLTLEDYLKSIQKTEEVMRKELLTPATTRVKSKIALKKISEVENLTASPTELETEIKLMSKTLGREEAQYKKTLGEGGLNYIKDYIGRRKALDYIVNNAQIKEGK